MLLNIPLNGHWLLRQENKLQIEMFQQIVFPIVFSIWLDDEKRKGKKSICIYGIFLDGKRQRQLGGQRAAGTMEINYSVNFLVRQH